jgi:hypothetical protein
MKKFCGVGVLLTMGLVLGGCVGGPASQSSDAVAESPVKTLTGKVMVSGKTVDIENQGIITEITSRKIDLTQYNGQTVSATGQFSGSTLYVDEVKQ